jgi:hypothetical protein
MPTRYQAHPARQEHGRTIPYRTFGPCCPMDDLSADRPGKDSSAHLTWRQDPKFYPVRSTVLAERPHGRGGLRKDIRIDSGG